MARSLRERKPANHDGIYDPGAYDKDSGNRMPESQALKYAYESDSGASDGDEDMEEFEFELEGPGLDHDAGEGDVEGDETGEAEVGKTEGEVVDLTGDDDDDDHDDDHDDDDVDAWEVTSASSDGGPAAGLLPKKRKQPHDNPTEDGDDEDVNAQEDDDAEKDAVVLEADAPSETRHLGLVASSKLRRTAMLALSIHLYRRGLPAWRLPVFPPYELIRNRECNEKLDDNFVSATVRNIRDFLSGKEKAYCPVDRTTGKVLPGGFYIGDAYSSEVLREEERFLEDRAIMLPDGEQIPERSMRRVILQVQLPEGTSHEMERKVIANFLWECPGTCLNRLVTGSAFVGQRTLYVTYYPDMTALLCLGKIIWGKVDRFGRGRTHIEGRVVPIAPESIYYPRVQPEAHGDPLNGLLVGPRAPPGRSKYAGVQRNQSGTYSAMASCSGKTKRCLTTFTLEVFAALVYDKIVESLEEAGALERTRTKNFKDREAYEDALASELNARDDIESAPDTETYDRALVHARLMVEAGKAIASGDSTRHMNEESGITFVSLTSSKHYRVEMRLGSEGTLVLDRMNYFSQGALARDIIIRKSGKKAELYFDGDRDLREQYESAIKAERARKDVEVVEEDTTYEAVEHKVDEYLAKKAQPKEDKPKSYKNVNQTSAGKWNAKIERKKIQQGLGTYRYKCNAALAVDIGLMKLGKKRENFKSNEAHLAALEAEMTERGEFKLEYCETQEEVINTAIGYAEELRKKLRSKQANSKKSSKKR